MKAQRIVRMQHDRPVVVSERERWLAEGRAALREIELAGGTLTDLEHAASVNPQAFCRLVEALRKLGAEIDQGTAALEHAAPQAPVVPLTRR